MKKLHTFSEHNVKSINEDNKLSSKPAKFETTTSSNITYINYTPEEKSGGSNVKDQYLKKVNLEVLDLVVNKYKELYWFVRITKKNGEQVEGYLKVDFALDTPEMTKFKKNFINTKLIFKKDLYKQQQKVKKKRLKSLSKEQDIDFRHEEPKQQ